MSTGMMARMMMMWNQMRRKQHHRPMMVAHRMLGTEGSVGITNEPVMSTVMRVQMAMVLMPMCMRRSNYCKLMMYQHRMWRTDHIVQVIIIIRVCVSDLQNMIIAKRVQRQAIYPKQRMYCNK
jgi:hypothetical protein